MIDVRLPEDLLDDTEALLRADVGGMLRAVASSGAQVRQARDASEESGVRRIVAADGRPRSVVVAGMGGSGIVGEILAAVTGAGCPVPVLSHRGYGLPGWVGPMDLVLAVSCSGATEETLSSAEEAARRGCRLVTIGAPGSPLGALAEQARAAHVPVDGGGRLPRSNVWALSVPLLVVADALGLASVPDDVLAATADQLDRAAAALAPSTELTANRAKTLALDLVGTLPVVWGSGEVAAAAAYRAACQINENAKLPATWGVLPELAHNQVVALDGPFVRAEDDDIFRDRVEEPTGASTCLQALLLRDTVESARVVRQRQALVAVAEARGVAVHEVLAEGDHPLERLASLVVVADFTSVYLALAGGTDPTPIVPITELKARLAD
jgi:glucose/mannose-6-phosphate isomerase